MKKINIECSDAMAGWVMGFMAMAQSLLGEQATVDVAAQAVGNTGSKARRGYRALNVNEIPKAMLALGTHTIMGIIFKFIADETVAGRLVTSRQVREKFHYKGTTVDTDIVKLRQGGLIEGVDL